jgi:hypothetical protein
MPVDQEFYRTGSVRHSPLGLPAIMETLEREKARVAWLNARFDLGAKADAVARKAVDIMAAVFIVNRMLKFLSLSMFGERGFLLFLCLVGSLLPSSLVFHHQPRKDLLRARASNLPRMTSL